jgi:hypothetical protein
VGLAFGDRTNRERGRVRQLEAEVRELLGRARRRSCGCWARSWKSSTRTGWFPAATSAAEVARRDRTFPGPRRARGALSVVHYEPTRSWTRKVHHTPGRDQRAGG